MNPDNASTVPAAANDTRFDPASVEADVSSRWKKAEAFSAARYPDGTRRDEVRANATPFTVVIPPPNVTGRLHMGHALNNTIQDLLVRHARMTGRDALWIPGTDHAGIATQTVVKKMLDAEGVDYRALGREKFIEKVWTWKEKYGGLILEQLARLGASVDLSRTRFTMDEGLSKAVRHAFVRLYREGLIYKGKRMVNWCPVDLTALSDDEVETAEGGESGSLWHIRYPLAEKTSEHLIVATTRPETLFGDSAVAVHPEDERYKHLIGKKVVLPLSGREIPVIADAYVDKDFGTGCLKITPAHDPNDYEVGLRHGLPILETMHPDATMNEAVPEAYRGLTREKCRTKAVADLEAAGLLEKVEPRRVPVGRSYRSRAIIEYRLSEQWFVKMKPLADEVMAKHADLEIKPAQWDKVYRHWMGGIRDWCISRQIWWGHRIPAWTHLETGETLVEEETPERVKAEPTKWRQESDVLDTWFSSALWPMSTLGWPGKTPDFDRYFPTSTLSTAKDIIFFWVARMNMMSVHFTGKMPYSRVFVHPTVMDEKGETMSKSKGNGIDPLHIIGGASRDDLKAPVMDARPSNMKELIARIEKNHPEGFPGVGADAMRWTLVYLLSGGQELRLSLTHFTDLGRRFLTKLWNATRFVLMYSEGLAPAAVEAARALPPTDEDRWILGRVAATTALVDKAIESHEFTGLGLTLYQLVWNDFCDWTIEIDKVRLQGSDEVAKAQALITLYAALGDILKLLHPVIPYVTEELWKRLGESGAKAKLWAPGRDDRDLIMVSAWPSAKAEAPGELEKRFELIQKTVGAIREIRATYQINDREKLSVLAKGKDAAAKSLLEKASPVIQRLAGLKELRFEGERAALSSASLLGEVELYTDLTGFMDVEKEKKRLAKEIDSAASEISSLEKRLGNPGFLSKAQPEHVEAEKERLTGLRLRLEKLQADAKNLASVK